MPGTTKWLGNHQPDSGSSLTLMAMLVDYCGPSGKKGTEENSCFKQQEKTKRHSCLLVDMPPHSSAQRLPHQRCNAFQDLVRPTRSKEILPFLHTTQKGQQWGEEGKHNNQGRKRQKQKQKSQEKNKHQRGENTKTKTLIDPSNSTTRRDVKDRKNWLTARVHKNLAFTNHRQGWSG